MSNLNLGRGRGYTMEIKLDADVITPIDAELGLPTEQITLAQG